MIFSTEGKETAEMLRSAQHDRLGCAALSVTVCERMLACLDGWMAMKTYYVYIMTNNSRTRYTGVTSNLERRVLEHKRKLLPGFTREYSINRLVYYETFGDIRAAIRREKQIKGWVRAKKVALIVSANPAWRDLSQGWYGKE
jgi:putative endonuclease